MNNIKIAIFSLFLLIPTISLAFTPARSINLYKMSLSIDTASLPDGLVFENGNLKNSSEFPFYIAKKTNLTFEKETELPSNYQPYAKIEKNSISYWQNQWIKRSTDLDDKGLYISPEIFFEGEYNRSHPIGVPGFSFSKSKQVSILNPLVPNPPNSELPPGTLSEIPENIIIPEPQEVFITGYYKGKEVAVKGKVVYTLNNSIYSLNKEYFIPAEYNEPGLKTSLKQSFLNNSYLNNRYTIPIVSLVVVSILILIIYRLNKKNSNNL